MSYIKALEPTPKLDELSTRLVHAIVAEHGEHLRCSACGGRVARPVVSAKIDLVGAVGAADLHLRCSDGCASTEVERPARHARRS